MLASMIAILHRQIPPFEMGRDLLMVFLVNGLVGLVEMLRADECKSPPSRNACSNHQKQQAGALDGRRQPRTQHSAHSQRKRNKLHPVC